MDDEGDKDSYVDCRLACESRSDCVQFTFNDSGGKCRTSNIIKLGQAISATIDSSGTTLTSGWLVDRVNVFVEEMDSWCQDHEGYWKLPRG
jgi:hypothetical protein